MAGTIGGLQYDDNDIYSGAMFAARVDFTADATDGTVPLGEYGMRFGSFLADIDFVSSDTMTVAIQVKTVDGVVSHPNDTISLSENTRYVLSDRPSLIGGFHLSITTAGAGDAGKSGTIILNLASNKR